MSSPKAGHKTSGSGQSPRRSGRAESGKIGCQHNYSPRKQKSSVLSTAYRKKFASMSSPEARTSEILYKPTEEHLLNPKTRTYHGRTARRSGRERSGKIGCQQNYLPRKQKFIVPSRASKKRRFNNSPEARTSEIPPIESKTRTHLRAGSAGRRAEAGRPAGKQQQQNCTSSTH